MSRFALQDPPRTTSPAAVGLALSSVTTTSRRWFDRSRAVLAGGISSSARATSFGDTPYPLFIQRGEGCRIWDVDGNEFVDCMMSYGCLPLGHAHPAVTEALRAQLEDGTMFGTCNTVEVELAEQIAALCPFVELLRFSNSGSEAICGAVRAARGFTGRNRIVKFEGHYHGWVDVLAVSNRPSVAQSGPAHAPASVAHSRGIPQSMVDDVVIAPWNDLPALRALLDAHKDKVAAIIAEPIVANNACTMPGPGFLQALRDECDARGIVLIFDEIVTGFRAALGGAAEAFGVHPDLAVYSKAVGGGLPLSAFGGSRKVMTPIAENTVKHGGTYNGNPIAATAALATLRELASPGVFERMHDAGNALMEAVRRSARDFSVACVAQGIGPMFQVLFGVTAPTTNYRDIHQVNMDAFAAFRQVLLVEGVHINPSGLACWFTSCAHGGDDIEIAARAIRIAMKHVASL